jgi:hypothetical protein
MAMRTRASGLWGGGQGGGSREEGLQGSGWAVSRGVGAAPCMEAPLRARRAPGGVVGRRGQAQRGVDVLCGAAGARDGGGFTIRAPSWRRRTARPRQAGHDTPMEPCPPPGHRCGCSPGWRPAPQGCSRASSQSSQRRRSRTGGSALGRGGGVWVGASGLNILIEASLWGGEGNRARPVQRSCQLPPSPLRLTPLHPAPPSSPELDLGGEVEAPVEERQVAQLGGR